LAAGTLLLDRLGRDARPGHLTLGFLLGHGVPATLLVGGLAAAQPWGADWARATTGLLCDRFVLLDLALLTVTTALAYHWLATYQPRVPASRAALVFLLEPIFGAVFSVAWEHDRVTLPCSSAAVCSSAATSWSNCPAGSDSGAPTTDRPYPKRLLTRLSVSA
jgi:drug/metabolite transporter (DMT)-like permease